MNRPVNQRLSLEIQFLILCCQTTLSQEDTTHIYEALETLKIEEIIELSYKQGVLPLVYKTLKTLHRQKPLNNHKLLEELKRHYLQIAQKNMLMSAELIRIMQMLKENHIEAIPFKGPALAQIAYGDITLRQFGDLDILIHKKDLESIITLFKRYEYFNTLDLTPTQKEHWYNYTKEISLYSPHKSINIDIHWRIFDTDYPLIFPYNTLWEKDTHPVLLNHTTIPTFSPETLLIYLTIHGAKHLFERITWIKDIDMYIRTQELNWDTIHQEIEQSEFKRMFLLGLYLAYIYFHTPLPQTYKEAFSNKPWLISLHTFIIQNWEEEKNFIYNTQAMLHLFPTVNQKMAYLHKVILKPSKNEYHFIVLPKKHYWMYYFIRPFLLLKKYIPFL